MRTTILKRVWLACLLTLAVSGASAQKGLLWEISGNGLSKPSYLYGTMHVSSRVAFNLGDSFFVALKNVDKVALESSPENWLAEFMRTDFMSGIVRMSAGDGGSGDSRIETSRYHYFKEFYGKDFVKQALWKDPDLLNQLMFRHTMSRQEFEEDTYLDLYIFQTASRLKKPVTSVEDLDESLRLVMQASVDMYPENKEVKYNPEFDTQLEEFYRQQELGKIDSLVMKQGYSENYNEKMLYTRNRNMLKSMDSLMKTGSLFTGVGAMHLPGKKGLIELLKAKGYNVRPVMMGERNGKIRSKLDAIEVPVTYTTQTFSDGLISVDAPGKMIVMPGTAFNQQYLYMDMVNRSFYSIIRVKTFADYSGYDLDKMTKSVDSLLYENIPGNIISKKKIEVNGYPGYDIVNRSKTGDVQHYKIVITPLEVIVAKTGGKGSYVKKNGEQFIRSFTVKNIHASAQEVANNKMGFGISVPSAAVYNFDRAELENFAPSAQIMQAVDKEGVSYMVMKLPQQNFMYLEEDTVELNVMEDGYLLGTNLKPVSHGFTSIGGYPALKGSYANAEKTNFMQAIFLIRGNSTYIASAYYHQEALADKAKGVLNTFKLLDLISEKSEERIDTTHRFKAFTPYKLPPDFNMFEYSFRKKKDEKSDYSGLFNNISFYDAETQQKVELKWQRVHKYYTAKDTATFWEEELGDLNKGADFIEISKKISSRNGIMQADLILGDTNSSRLIIHKVLVKGRYIYTLSSLTDTLAKEGNNFVKTFFETFMVTDTSTYNMFGNQTAVFLSDILSDDSATYAIARSLKDDTRLRGKSYKPLAECIAKLKEDKYRNGIRSTLVQEIGYTKDQSAIAYLKSAYLKNNDDYDYQLDILQALAALNTTASYATLKELILKETPFATEGYYGLFIYLSLEDTLWLRAKLMPELLQLAKHNEYRDHMYMLLAELCDSNKITTAAYASYLTAIINDARKELKQELTDDIKETYNANSTLEMYNRILIRSYDNPQVKELFEKQLKAKNYHVKLAAAAILLRFNKPVQDSIFHNLAKNDDTRVLVYKKLKEIKRLDKLPADEITQDKLAYATARRSVKPGYGENRLDSLVFLQKQQTYFRGKMGVMYFYKYKLSNSDEWDTYVCGMLPDDMKDFYMVKFLSGKGTEDFDDKKDITEQFTDLLKMRKEKARFGSGGDYDFSDMDFNLDDNDY